MEPKAEARQFLRWLAQAILFASLDDVPRLSAFTSSAFTRPRHHHCKGAADTCNEGSNATSAAHDEQFEGNLCVQQNVSHSSQAIVVQGDVVMASITGSERAEGPSSLVPARIIAKLSAWLESRGKIRKRIRHSEEVGTTTPAVRHQYETIGYLVEGRAQLEIEGQRLLLEPGHSWVVPGGAEHRFTILEPFTAVEATDAARPVRYRARSAGSD